MIQSFSSIFCLLARACRSMFCVFVFCFHCRRVLSNTIIAFACFVSMSSRIVWWTYLLFMNNGTTSIKTFTVCLTTFIEQSLRAIMRLVVYVSHDQRSSTHIFFVIWWSSHWRLPECMKIACARRSVIWPVYGGWLNTECFICTMTYLVIEVDTFSGACMMWTGYRNEKSIDNDVESATQQVVF